MHERWLHKSVHNVSLEMNNVEESNTQLTFLIGFEENLPQREDKGMGVMKTLE